MLRKEASLKIKTRKVLLCSLLASFCIQSSLVYFDDTADKKAPLSSLAREGQKIWLANNCQSCHQIYGFGGFLGPDLTNAAKRLTENRLANILTEGSAQMPAYHFGSVEQNALMSFFQEIDKTGHGLPSLNKGSAADPVLHFYASIKELLKSESNKQIHNAFELVQQYSCISCHLPNEKSVYRAPDLRFISSSRTQDEIDTILIEGRIEKGMPSFQMTEEKRKDVYTFLTWLHAHNEEFSKVYSKSDSLTMLEFLKKIPWFEYENE